MSEPLRADLAPIRRIASVNFHVLPQADHVHESLLAVITVVGSVYRVDRFSMRPQEGVALVPPAAFLTLERQLSGVHLHVLPEFHRVKKLDLANARTYTFHSCWLAIELNSRLHSRNTRPESKVHPTPGLAACLRNLVWHFEMWRLSFSISGNFLLQ